METPLEILIDFDGLRMRDDLTRVPFLGGLDRTSSVRDKHSEHAEGRTYSDTFLVCLGIRLAGQSVFSKVRLGGLNVHNRILQSLLVSLPFLPCTLEGMLRLCERCSRLLEFLFDDLQSLLKGFLLGLQITSQRS